MRKTKPRRSSSFPDFRALSTDELYYTILPTKVTVFASPLRQPPLDKFVLALAAKDDPGFYAKSTFIDLGTHALVGIDVVQRSARLDICHIDPVPLSSLLQFGFDYQIESLSPPGKVLVPTDYLFSGPQDSETMAYRRTFIARAVLRTLLPLLTRRDESIFLTPTLFTGSTDLPPYSCTSSSGTALRYAPGCVGCGFCLSAFRYAAIPPLRPHDYWNQQNIGAFCYLYGLCPPLSWVQVNPEHLVAPTSLTVFSEDGSATQVNYFDSSAIGLSCVRASFDLCDPVTKFMMAARYPFLFSHFADLPSIVREILSAICLYYDELLFIYTFPSLGDIILSYHVDLSPAISSDFIRNSVLPIFRIIHG
jgi:hypothetical protein